MDLAHTEVKPSKYGCVGTEGTLTAHWIPIETGEKLDTNPTRKNGVSKIITASW